MLLKPQVPLALCCGALMAFSAQAQDTWGSGIQYRYQGAIGFDTWDVSTNAAPGTRSERLLFLANSTPQWSERNPSPWLRFDGSAVITPKLDARFKFRGSQSSDWRIDELNLNWQLSPTLGATAGVVDYKTSWCRAYDVESPWVRENDPLCTVRTTEQATGAAPGVQLHTNWIAGNVMWQAQVGAYNPLLLSYDDEEFNNTPLPNSSFVSRNRKHGISVSAVQLYSGAELRLSYLKTQQIGKHDPGPRHPPYDKPQGVDVVFAGLTLPIHSNLQLRLTHLDSQLDSRFVASDAPSWIYDYGYHRKSTTAELFWQLNALDTLAFGYSHFVATEQTDITSKANSDERRQIRASTFTNQIWSASWRRNWSETFYTALQWSESKSVDRITTQRSIPPVYSTRMTQSEGHAIGLRVGVRF